MPMEFDIDELALIQKGENELTSLVLAHQSIAHLLITMSNVYRTIYASLKGCDFNGHHKDNNAFISCIMNCHYDMDLGLLAVTRGHISDSALYTRRAIEYAAFGSRLLQVLLNEPATRDSTMPHRMTEIYLNSCNSKTAFAKYRKHFPLVPTVNESASVFGGWFTEQYDELSKDVHGSYVSMMARMDSAETALSIDFFEVVGVPKVKRTFKRLFHLVEIHLCITRGFSQLLRANSAFRAADCDLIQKQAEDELEFEKNNWTLDGEFSG